MGMSIIEQLDPVSFSNYLKKYHNTICGRHPIGVLLNVSIFWKTIFFEDFIYLFLGRGEWKEKEGKKHQYVVASHVLPPGDLAYNLGMCPDWESNWQCFGWQACTQSTKT
ncbi:mediator of cell motility 1 [Phyllostomus discolor]|uniref:Protein MEMO1 n=1 Tax=Phyllostomus discolor TaxID=89673 RepID=A0A834A5D8_9CHIR|nr:mediator of cell motility 1 [Phyllostomus discolor]